MGQHDDPTVVPDARHPAVPPATDPPPGAPRGKAELREAIRTKRRAVMVVNTHSRRGQRLYQVAHDRLTAAGFDLLGCFPVDRPTRLRATLAEAVTMAPDLLVVGGGDGTLSETVHHLAHRDIALGVLPLGTTNNFARTLSIPPSLPEALTVLTDGKVADVDLGQAGEHVFANLVSLGVSAQVAGRVPHRLKRVLGRVAYPLTAAAALPAHRPFHATITADGHDHELDTHQLNIANGAFHAGRPITADASADDRLLTVSTLGGRTRRSLIAAIVRHAARHGHAEILSTGELSLRTDPPLPLDIDGELIGHTPVRIRVAANALRVMVGADFADT